MCMCVSDRERGQKPLFSLFNQKLALAVSQALLQGQTCFTAWASGVLLGQPA